jgi:hypothetical protein
VTKNPKLLIAVVAVAAAVAAYWMLVLAPKREQLAKLDTDLVTAQAELDQTRSTLATYDKARGAYRANYATVVRLGKAVPADDDVRSLVVQLDSAAEASGITFDQITVGEASGASKPATDSAGSAPPPGAVSVGAAGFTAMPFKFGFDGSFDNMSTFFSRLERFVTVSNEQIGVTGRLLRLESLELVPVAGTNRITAQIGASSYLLPAGEGLTGGGSAAAPAGAPASTAAAPASGSSTPPTTTATSTGVIR